MKSKVSVCIPTYNSDRFLRAMLDSIVEQSYENLEVIISDNSSTDNTVSIAQEFCNKHGWRLYENEVNIGAGRNFNKLIGLASGEYIAIYHADDVYASSIVEESVELFARHNSLGMVSTLGYEIDENDKIITEYILPKHLVKKAEYKFDDIFKMILRQEGLFLITPSVMVRREAYEKCGEFYLNGKYGSAGDYEMWLRILQKYNISIIDRPLLRYRTHCNQGSELEIRRNLNLPDSLNVYYDYMSLDKEKYLDLYNYTFYMLARVLAIKHNNNNNFYESNKTINLIFKQTSSYHLSLILLRIFNFLRFKINIKILIYIKRLMKS